MWRTSAPQKIADIIGVFARKTAAAKERGSKFLLGNALSAIDIYWATVSFMLRPPPPEVLPRTRQNEAAMKAWAKNPLSELVTQDMWDHRDYILHTYCETPIVL